MKLAPDYQKVAGTYRHEGSGITIPTEVDGFRRQGALASPAGEEAVTFAFAEGRVDYFRSNRFSVTIRPAETPDTSPEAELARALERYPSRHRDPEGVELLVCGTAHAGLRVTFRREGRPSRFDLTVVPMDRWVVEGRFNYEPFLEESYWQAFQEILETPCEDRTPRPVRRPWLGEVLPPIGSAGCLPSRGRSTRSAWPPRAARCSSRPIRQAR
jgi:hypothetical protein